MYTIKEKESVVRIPPNRLGEPMDKLVAELTRATFEGQIEGNEGLTVLVLDVNPDGDGRIVHGDGGVYQSVKYQALVFAPENQEIVEGTVCEVLKFGVFIRFGPLDGLLHISQIMDDRIDVNQESQALIGKDTKRDIKREDKVRARIVSLSLNERAPRESKIGLTMRQLGLGKLEWLAKELKDKEPPKEKEAKPKEEKGGK